MLVQTVRLELEGALLDAEKGRKVRDEAAVLDRAYAQLQRENAEVLAEQEANILELQIVRLELEEALAL